mgnify:CR=1 FL=1
MIGLLFTVAFFLFPGLLLFAIRHTTFFPKLSVIEKLPISIASSLAYWIISFWFLQYIPIPLHIHVYTTIGISAVAFTALLIQGRIPGGQLNIVVSLFFLILMIPGFVVALREVAPSGADMSMQAYIAKSIFLTNGFPKTLEPIVPVSQFGTYPVGFPILIASLMKANALPVYTNALWLSVFTYWFFAVSVFVLLRTTFPVFTSMMVTILISWASKTPLDFIPWGANPTILSLAFIIIAIAALSQYKDKTATVCASLFVFASVLTHYILPAAAGYLAVMCLPFYWSSISRFIIMWNKFRFTTLFIFALMLPWIIHVTNNLSSVSPSTLLYVATLQRDELTTLSGELIASISPVAVLYNFYVHTFGSPILILYLFSLATLLLVHPKSVLLHGVAVIGISALILNALHWWLPLSYLLYPKRVALILLIPMAFAAAQALQFNIQTVYKHFIIHNTRNHMLLHVIVVVLLGYIFWPYVRIALRGYTLQSYLYVVTPSDIAAMRWLSENTTPDDVIRNNYWDAGLWIPAIAGRKITLYHTNPFDRDILRNNGRETYAYVGKKTITYPPSADPVNHETLSQDPERYTLVYEHDGVSIYKIHRDE